MLARVLLRLYVNHNRSKPTFDTKSPIAPKQNFCLNTIGAFVLMAGFKRAWLASADRARVLEGADRSLLLDLGAVLGRDVAGRHLRTAP